MWRSALALAAVLAACSTSPGLDPYQSDRPALVVEKGPLEKHVILTGELEAADSVEMAVPRTSTWQVSIRWIAEDGSRVKKGDRLLEFDNSSMAERIKELEQAIVNAENAMVSQEATDDLAIADKELEVERQRIAVAKAELDAKVPRSLISRRDWQENRLALERARTAHQSAVDDLEATRKAAALERQVKKIDYENAVRNHERTVQEVDALVLEAPRDGVLVVADHPWFGRRLQVGDVVRPGFEAVSVSNLSAMKVTAQLSDVDDGQVEAGMPAECVLDAYPDRVFTGTVEAVSEIAREPSESSVRRFFAVTVALDETDSEVMRPGMSVKVDILAREIGEAVIAPREGLALGGETEDARARVEGGGERTIAVDWCTARHCIVTEGLAPGDRLRYREVAP